MLEHCASKHGETPNLCLRIFTALLPLVLTAPFTFDITMHDRFSARTTMIVQDGNRSIGHEELWSSCQTFLLASLNPTRYIFRLTTDIIALNRDVFILIYKASQVLGVEKCSLPGSSQIGQESLPVAWQMSSLRSFVRSQVPSCNPDSTFFNWCTFWMIQLVVFDLIITS